MFRDEGGDGISSSSSSQTLRRSRSRFGLRAGAAVRGAVALRAVLVERPADDLGSARRRFAALPPARFPADALLLELFLLAPLLFALVPPARVAVARFAAAPFPGARFLVVLFLVEPFLVEPFLVVRVAAAFFVEPRALFLRDRDAFAREVAPRFCRVAAFAVFFDARAPFAAFFLDLAISGNPFPFTLTGRAK